MANFRVDLPKDVSNIIKVLGVGGGGGNAVNHMFREGIIGVDFIICNTDAQALEMSPIPNKIQLGTSLSEGLGAGSNPEMGRLAAEESKAQILDILSHNTKMVFVTAGMGGGTGTGAAPVIAKIAKDLDILTLGIVTTPFEDEGPVRIKQALAGIEEMKPYVDALLVISNDRIVEIFGDLRISEAFSKADDILCTAAKGIAEIITVPGKMNVDFKDIKTAMSGSGRAIMGNAVAVGEKRAEEAARKALESPLLNDTRIEGASHLLVNITYGTEEPFAREVKIITQYFQEESGLNAQLKFGLCHDPLMGPEISVTIIATGFGKNNPNAVIGSSEEKQGIIIDLDIETSVIAETAETQAIQKSLFEKQEEKSTFREQVIEQGSNPYKNHNIRQEEVDLYNTPAYLRQGVTLNEIPNNIELSRLNLAEETETSRNVSLKPGNSYLHDNVD